MVVYVSDFRQWIHRTTGTRVTAEDIAQALGISRTSVTRRLVGDGLEAGEVIVLCRHFGVRPLQALVDMGYLTDREVWDYLESEGQLVETADEGELALELARRLNPATRAPEIDDLVMRRCVPCIPDGGEDWTKDLDYERYAAHPHTKNLDVDNWE